MKSPGQGMRVIILAAGYATRLYPLTLHIPKPLLRVTKDRTVIDFIVDDLERAGNFDGITVVTNHKFYADFLKWAKNRRFGCPLTVLNDGTRTNDDRLGAVGDIFYAAVKERIAADVVVIGGDNLFDRGFKKFLDFAREKRPFASLGLFDIGSFKEAARFGVVSVDKKGRVTRFEEKPATPRSTTVATCLYYFPKATLAFLRRYVADPATSKDAPGHYIRWLMEKDRVYGFALRKGQWHDIGHFDSYKDVVGRFHKKLISR